MAPLTKDSVEVASPAGGSAISQPTSQAKPSSGLRADALSLEVHVKVHGSRVIEVERGTAPKTEPFEEQTVTMIVFPQGAVLRMTTPVGVSQMLVLTNIKSKQDSICRVLKVRPNASHGSYVEVEFTHRQPGYWGVSFPSDGADVATPTAPARSESESQPSQSRAQAPVIAPATPSVSRPAAGNPVARDAKPAAHVSPSTSFVPAVKPESSFIAIGSQERVQEAASATATTKPLSPVERRIENAAAPVAKTVPAADSLPSATPPSFSMAELQGDDDSDSSGATATATKSSSADVEDSAGAPAVAASSTSSREVFGSYAAISHPAQTEAFGSRLDSGLGTSAARDSGSNQNWMLIAACIAVLVAGLGAGIAYFRQHSSNGAGSGARASSAAAQPVQSASPQLPAITPAGQPYMAANSEPSAASRSNAPAPSIVNSAPANSPSDVKPIDAKSNDSKSNDPRPLASNSNRPPAPAKQPAPSVTNDMMSSALTARPTTSARGGEGQSDSAPTIDPSAGASGASSLAGIASSNAASLPSPEMRPEGPIKIGGNVKAPRLISSVAPQYPPIARSSGQQGDVVVETTIDKSGNVVRMHVVSGPAGLRGAAMDALKRWKYEPSSLDGEPVEVQMQVTIKFRM